MLSVRRQYSQGSEQVQCAREPGGMCGGELQRRRCRLLLSLCTLHTPVGSHVRFKVFASLGKVCRVCPNMRQHTGGGAPCMLWLQADAVGRSAHYPGPVGIQKSCRSLRTHPHRGQNPRTHRLNWVSACGALEDLQRAMPGAHDI